MNEANQPIIPDASAVVPVKRKRGRPRKYPRADSDNVRSVNIAGDQNVSRGHNAYAPPGFIGVNGNQHHPVDAPNHTNDPMIGQLVHGVVEAAFDAGYLLTVRVGNSETTLRGLVFKPGRYVPVSPDNDVAPGVPMIKRSEVPLPTRNYAQGQAYSYSKDRNGSSQDAQAANLAAHRGQQTSSIVMHPAPSGLSRGNVVPVVLQPVKVSNGIPVSSQPTTVATQLVASKGKEVLDAVHPSNGDTPTNQTQAVGNQMVHFQPQNNHLVMSSGLPSGAVPFKQSPAEGLHGAEVKSTALLTKPFETLLTEVMKRVEVPSLSTETNSRSADKMSGKDPVTDVEDDDGSDSDQALSVEPLQAVQPGFPVPPVVVSRPLESYGAGKMTELLKVLQENMIEKQATQTNEQAAASGRKLD